MVNRPGWWPSWLPETDDAGHEFVAPRARSSWMACSCPGTDDTKGHFVWWCGTLGCSARVWPPEHSGPARNQR
jgi:hypothetical protein